MTADECAEKIVSGLGPRALSAKAHWTPYDYDLAKQIVAEIRRAVEEAKHCCFEFDSSCNNRDREIEKIKRSCVSGSQASYIAQGKAEAYEEAAKIAETIFVGHIWTAKDAGIIGATKNKIAEAIRARANGI